MEGQQFNITEGNNGSITCTATGYPVPTVVWQNSDGSSLSNNRLVSGSPVISSTGVSNVTSVSVELMVIGAMRVDTGMYRCSANNSINYTTRNININVQGTVHLKCNFAHVRMCIISYVERTCMCMLTYAHVYVHTSQASKHLLTSHVCTLHLRVLTCAIIACMSILYIDTGVS